jgi:hypothetical protein
MFTWMYACPPVRLLEEQWKLHLQDTHADSNYPPTPSGLLIQSPFRFHGSLIPPHAPSSNILRTRAFRSKGFHGGGGVEAWGSPSTDHLDVSIAKETKARSGNRQDLQSIGEYRKTSATSFANFEAVPSIWGLFFLEGLQV